jgi:hypothetical protein
VWHEASKQWINPATGQTADPPPGKDQLWNLSYNELTDATVAAGRRAEYLHEHGTAEEIAAADAEYQALSAAHKNRTIASLEQQIAEAKQRGDTQTAEMKQRALDRTHKDRSSSVPPNPKPTSKNPGTSSPGGTTMFGSDTYGGLRARVQGVASRMQERRGLLQQAHGDIEQDVAEIHQIIEGSNEAGVQEALGLLLQAMESADHAIQTVGAAEQSLEGAAAALS